jgi:hypothetical protein
MVFRGPSDGPERAAWEQRQIDFECRVGAVEERLAQIREWRRRLRQQSRTIEHSPRMLRQYYE